MTMRPGVLATSLVATVLFLGAAACYQSSIDLNGPSDGDASPDGDDDGGDRGRDFGRDADADVILPCALLTDTDGDTIADQYEGTASDIDGDTVPNYLDADSDNDGIPDAEEAGTGGDFCNYPRDSDGDTIIDALDFDSDNDGLGDREEHERWGTDPTSPDTDGDGFTDFAEVAYGSDPLDPTSFPDPGDIFVIVPYLEPPQVRQVTFGTDVQRADVYFLLDSTGSMETAIANVIDSLAGTILPGLRTALPDVQLGVGAFNDFPVSPYGDTGPTGGADQPYWHDQDITDDDWIIRTALRNVLARPRGYGADSEESAVVALYLAASGEGLVMGGADIPPKTCAPWPDEPETRRGYPCFRSGVLPIIVLVGDAPFHNGPLGEAPYVFAAPTYPDAVAALLGIGARVVGVYVDNWDTSGLALEQQRQLARDTGAVDAAGSPLVSVSTGGSVSVDLVDLVTRLTRSPMDIVTTIEDGPAEDLYGVDARVFVTAVAPVSAFPASGCAGWDATTFFAVQPGTSVTFNATFQNTIFPPRDAAAAFELTVVVLGNGVVRLDSRRFILIVPPTGDWVF
jgi:hypothetical protein